MRTEVRTLPLQIKPQLFGAFLWMYIVYVLYFELYYKTYTVMSSNMEERFKSHNELGKKGWTKNYRPWIIFYQEEYLEKHIALKREKYLKSGAGRKFIRSLNEMRQK